jgi:signal transduction histidine kinase
MSIRRRLAAAGVVGLILVATVCAISLYQFGKITRIGHELQEERRNQGEAIRLQLAVDQMLTSLPDRSEKGTKCFGRSVDRVRQALAALTAAPLREELRNREHEEKEKRLLAAIADEFDVLVEAGRAARSPACASGGPEPPPRGRERIEDLVEEFIDADRRHVEDCTREQARAQARATVALLGGGAMALVLGLFWALVLHRQISRPIAQLTAGARRLADRDFSAPLAVKDPDEIRVLAGEFQQMADRLRDSYAGLEAKVEERTKMLLQAARLAGIGTVASGVAHEINNPMATIAGCAEGLLGRLPPGSEAQREYLELILAEAYRVKGITTRLLDFAGRREPQRETVDLCELVESTTVLLRPGDGGADRVRMQACRAPVKVTVDRSQIGQVVFHLIQNALDATGQGGEVTIAVRPEAGGAALRVSDTGHGFGPETAKRLFEPFFTTRPAGRGAGLGLALCREIVLSHGGRIHADSPGPGQGATFTVFLPGGSGDNPPPPWKKTSGS